MGPRLTSGRASLSANKPGADLRPGCGKRRVPRALKADRNDTPTLRCVSLRNSQIPRLAIPPGRTRVTEIEPDEVLAAGVTPDAKAFMALFGIAVPMVPFFGPPE